METPPASEDAQGKPHHSQDTPDDARPTIRLWFNREGMRLFLTSGKVLQVGNTAPDVRRADTARAERRVKKERMAAEKTMKQERFEYESERL